LAKITVGDWASYAFPSYLISALPTRSFDPALARRPLIRDSTGWPMTAASLPEAFARAGPPTSDGDVAG